MGGGGRDKGGDAGEPGQGRVGQGEARRGEAKQRARPAAVKGPADNGEFGGR